MQEERTTAAAILAEVTARAMAAVRGPHRPLGDAATIATLEAPLRGLPLTAALAAPPLAVARKVLVREEKDRRLKRVILELAQAGGAPLAVIANPCSVFGRHARDLARALPEVTVVATDVNPTWERMYALSERLRGRRPPPRYRFVVGSVFDSVPGVDPDLVTVFGGCGSLTDGALALAARAGARHVVLRACCHENIGANWELSTFAPTIWNIGHRIKNRCFRAAHRRRGYYAHPRFGPQAYPQSAALRRSMDPDGILRLARHAVDCGGCRLVIDLDRLCFLGEHGYLVRGYHQGMIVAERVAPASDERSVS